MDIGSIPIAAGIGLRIIRGVGRRFTMAVGFIIRAVVGAGGQTPFGVRHGSLGGIRAIIAAGRRCRRARRIGKALDSFFKAAPSALGLTLV